MRYVARLLIALVVLTSAAVLLLGVGGGVGVWLVRGPLTEKATRAFAKAEAALDKAEGGLALVRASLDNAAERLAAVRREQRELARNAPMRGFKQRLMATTLRQTVAPVLGDATDRLSDIAEAAVAVKGVLEAAADSPMLPVTGLDGDQLLQIKAKLAGAAPAAWELSRLLNDSGPDAEIEAQSTRVDEILRSGQGMVAEWQARLSAVREQADGLRAKTFAWITPGAALISAACFWISLSQLSVLAHARSWWKRLGRPN